MALFFFFNVSRDLFPLTEVRGAAGGLPMVVNQCTESEGECCAAGAAREVRDKRRRKEAAKERL